MKPKHLGLFSAHGKKVYTDAMLSLRHNCMLPKLQNWPGNMGRISRIAYYPLENLITAKKNSENLLWFLHYYHIWFTGTSLHLYLVFWVMQSTQIMHLCNARSWPGEYRVKSKVRSQLEQGNLPKTAEHRATHSC